jgi:hypothetical protein
MNVEENPESPDSEDSEPDLKQYVRLVCETHGKCAGDLWPSIWMSFASILILAVTLAILSNRMGTQSCR